MSADEPVRRLSTSGRVFAVWAGLYLVGAAWQGLRDEWANAASQLFLAAVWATLPVRQWWRHRSTA